MEYFASRWQDYHPILVGAGCLALGYVYGRHCRFVVENQHIHYIPMELDATCNHVVGRAMVEPKGITMVQGPTSCPSDSTLNYSNRNIDMTTERIGKRTVGQLEIFQMPKKNEDVLWFDSSAFKKQKGVPVITIQKKEPITESKVEVVEPSYDSDDEILAKRLEYFTNQSASINKPSGSNHVLKLGKKKKKKKRSTVEVMTMSSKRKDLVTIDSQKSLSKTSTRSKSGLCELANMKGECSLEDTCRSPKTTICLENSIQVEETNSTHTVFVSEQVAMPYAQASKLEHDVRNSMEEHIKDGNVGFMDSQCELTEPANDLDHTMGEHDEEERLENVKTEDGIACKENDTIVVESLEEKVSTNCPTESHGFALHVMDKLQSQKLQDFQRNELLQRFHWLGTVQDRCLMEIKPKVDKEHKISMDKVLKVEIYELLHSSDYAEVSFQEIVSVLEEKLKVVLREDKAHIVSLVREVISISKLLEEEKALEGLEQIEGALNVCC